MIKNCFKQKSLYFIGIFIGLSSRIKKMILRLKSPKPRMLSNNDYLANFNYSQSILEKISKIVGEKNFLENKKVLEIGPGPDLLLGLMMLDLGCHSYQAIDYFPVLSAPKYFYENIRKNLVNTQAIIAADCLINSKEDYKKIQSPEISYKIMDVKDLTEQEMTYDFIFSKDVLEHVDDLESAFVSMKRSLSPNGIMVHKIDFQTHTSFIQESDRLNFLRYSDYIYKKFVKFKGGPNRLRLAAVLDLAKKSGFQILKVEIDKEMGDLELEQVKKYLSKEYRNLDDQHLRPLSAWVILK